LRENVWVDKPGPATRLEIRVKSPEVVHEVSILQVTRWLDGSSISPKRDGKEAEAEGNVGLN
jgi:hypothetical protein